MKDADLYQELPTTVVFDRHQLVTATFSWPWPHTLSGETYTIDSPPNISVEFDKFIPIHPVNIRVATVDDATLNTLEEIGGQELRQAVRHATLEGLIFCTTRLMRNHREKLARIQKESPSTPPIVRRACLFVLDAIDRATDLTNGVHGDGVAALQHANGLHGGR